MIIFVDSNQKDGKHEQKHKYLTDAGYELVRKRLCVGDYMIEGNDYISIDTKQDLGEMCNNLIGSQKEHCRVMNEIRRAKDNHIKLVFLIEQRGYHSIEDVKNYNPKYGYRLTGRKLMEKMYTVHISYGVDFLFCDKRNTGKEIIRILTEGA